MAAEPEHHPPSSILHPRPLLLAGPTAVGKSEIALLLAEKLGGEIISVDSMQVYRGLDIGTAKPSPEERARVPHHLIDVVDLTEPFDAAQFVQLAHRAVADIQSRGRLPILCGGTGLYFKAFLEGLGPGAAGRRRFARRTGSHALAGAAARTGRARSGDLRTNRPPKPAPGHSRHRGHSPDRPTLLRPARRLAPRTTHHATRSPTASASRAPRRTCSRRIDARVDAMFRRGWVAETEQLLQRGLAQNQTAMQALGYRQIVEHLRGERSLPETIELVKIRTRQFAKRQMTWFRRQLRLTWINLEPQGSAEAVVKTIAGTLNLFTAGRD